MGGAERMGGQAALKSNTNTHPPSIKQSSEAGIRRMVRIDGKEDDKARVHGRYIS